MVDQTQTNTLQQSGSNAGTGNPQQIGQTELQPSATQSINDFYQLDQGGQAISLNSVPSTSKTTSQTTAATTPTSANHILVYGGIGIIAAAILAGLIYGLLRQR